MTRPARKESREASALRRLERTRALLATPQFLDFVLDVLDYLEPSAIFAPNSQTLANHATRQDAANWLKRQLLAADANAAWILERERMRRRREHNDGRSGDDRNDRRSEFPGSDDDVGGDRDE
jgi:hypothetical protein